MSAKLGIVTGRNLAEMCREHFPRPVVYTLWIVSEVAAMATDLAEFLGGAIGLSLLLHIPLIAGMGVTAVLTYTLAFLAPDIEGRLPHGSRRVSFSRSASRARTSRRCAGGSV